MRQVGLQEDEACWNDYDFYGGYEVFDSSESHSLSEEWFVESFILSQLFDRIYKYLIEIW